jgi:hypothetical protein
MIMKRSNPLKNNARSKLVPVIKEGNITTSKKVRLKKKEKGKQPLATAQKLLCIVATSYSIMIERRYRRIVVEVLLLHAL